MSVSYNKIITPLIKTTYETKEGKTKTTSNIKDLTSLLIQDCATEIHMIPYDEIEKEYLIKELEQLPSSFKNRVKIADKNFYQKKRINKFLDEINEHMKKGISLKNKEDLEYEIKYTDQYLETILRTICVACQEKGEADIPIADSLGTRLQLSKLRCESDEGKARVDLLFGLFSCYRYNENEGFSVDVAKYDQMHISERLDDLLIEPSLQEISQLRRNFGLKQFLKNLPELKETIKHKTNNLLKNKIIRSILTSAPEKIALATQPDFAPFLSSLPLPEWEQFSPPLVDLLGKRKQILEQIPNTINQKFSLADVPLDFQEFQKGNQNFTTPMYRLGSYSTIEPITKEMEQNWAYLRPTLGNDGVDYTLVVAGDVKAYHKLSYL